MDFLSDSNELAATDVMNFVREAIQRYNNLKDLILEKLLEGKIAPMKPTVTLILTQLMF